MDYKHYLARAEALMRLAVDVSDKEQKLKLLDCAREYLIMSEQCWGVSKLHKAGWYLSYITGQKMYLQELRTRIAQT